MARRPVTAVADAPVFDTTTPSRAAVRRMLPAEVDTYASWLVPLIQQYWDDPAIATVKGWLRMWSLSNHYNLGCTDDAVGLAQLVHDPMHVKPRVEEVFMFCKPGHTEDGIAIYAHWARWAKTAGADEFRFNHVMGAPIDGIKAIFPDLQYRKMWFTEVG